MGMPLFRPVVAHIDGYAAFSCGPDNYRILLGQSNHPIDRKEDWKYYWSPESGFANRLTSAPVSPLVHPVQLLGEDAPFRYRNTIESIHSQARESFWSLSFSPPREVRVGMVSLAGMQQTLQEVFDEYFAEHPQADKIMQLAVEDTAVLFAKLQSLGQENKQNIYHNPLLLLN